MRQNNPDTESQEGYYKKRNYKSLSLMNIDTKIPNKTVTN